MQWFSSVPAPARQLRRRKSLKYRMAIELMRHPDTRLIMTHEPAGPAHYVVPRGGYLDSCTAAHVKRHPQVSSGCDALFPGMAQTWRLIHRKQKEL